MLRAVAWPRGLHAIASAPIGNAVWNDLRRKATGALSFHRPGVNGFILLGLLEAFVDPQFLGLVWTCREARSRSPREFWQHSIAPLAHGLLDLPPSSLASVLVARLQFVGLSVLPCGRVADQFGVFCMQTTNSTEVELRLLRAWCQVVAAKVAHRTDFQGLGQVDLVASRKALLKLPVDDQALLRFSMAGGLFTESYKAKWTSQSEQCRWCGATDSLKHRYWECEQHLDLRCKLAPDAVAHLDLIPPALSLRGWSLLPSTWTDWMVTLAALPTEMPVPAVALCPESWNNVFTDGSCFWQNQPQFRLASWSAVLATPFDGAWHPSPASVIGASVLSGFCQTAYRAELTALAYCLSCAARARAPIRVWSDCLGVVNKFKLLFWGSGRINHNRPNSDLRLWIADSVDTLGLDRIQIVKVQAHRTLQSAQTLHDAWAFFHNAVADRAARLANQARPQKFWQQWEQHAQETCAVEKLAAQVQALHLAVGKRHVQAPQQETTDAPIEPKETRQFEQNFSLGAWTGACPPKVARLFGPSHVQRVARWFWDRLLPTDSNLVWVSFSQLYIDFQLAWNHPGPIKVHQQWIDTDLRRYVAAERFSFRQRVKWFKQLMKAFWKEAGLAVAMAQTRPLSMMLQAYLPAASLPWPSQAIEKVDTRLASQLTAPCTRDAAVLAALPLAITKGGTRADPT